MTVGFDSSARSHHFNDLYTLVALDNYTGDIATDFVAFWRALTTVTYVGALHVDATHIPLASVTTQGFCSVFDAMCSPRLSRVHLRLACDISLPNFWRAMATDSVRNDAVALRDRITVEFLWVEDAVSRPSKTLAKSLEPVSACACTEASTGSRPDCSAQARQVCAAVEAWCDGSILSHTLASPEFELDGVEMPAGEISGVNRFGRSCWRCAVHRICRGEAQCHETVRQGSQRSVGRCSSVAGPDDYNSRRFGGHSAAPV